VNIVHLSTSTTGGAAVTAKSIARIQRAFGHNSEVITRSTTLSAVALAKSRFSTFISLENATRQYSQVTHFSSLAIELESIWDLKPDVIFIHNWFNLLREKDIISFTNRTPTVFVAHDARLATGGCHVTLGCRNFETGCKHCPAARIDWLSSTAKNSLDSAISQFGKYAVVTPSRWLMNEMTGSSIIAKATSRRVIGNPSEAFANYEELAPSHSSGRFKIIFLAASMNSAYKGFGLLMESLFLIDANQEFLTNLEINIVGSGSTGRLPAFDSRIKVNFQGTKNSQDVQRLIRESDLMVVPSLSENYPGVIGEAQILGCTVAATNVGGIPEMIEDGVTGYLFEPNAHACMMAIIRAINSPSRSEIKALARERALLRHDETRINHEYEEVIYELIKS
jgi:glycosyltransferase involved in cell wall biosynthesis